MDPPTSRSAAPGSCMGQAGGSARPGCLRGVPEPAIGGTTTLPLPRCNSVLTPSAQDYHRAEVHGRMRCDERCPVRDRGPWGEVGHSSHASKRRLWAIPSDPGIAMVAARSGRRRCAHRALVEPPPTRRSGTLRALPCPSAECRLTRQSHTNRCAHHRDPERMRNGAYSTRRASDLGKDLARRSQCRRGTAGKRRMPWTYARCRDAPPSRRTGTWRGAPTGISLAWPHEPKP
jgi:hypothetical protein